MSMSVSGRSTGQFLNFTSIDGRRARRQAWLPEAERLRDEGKTYAQIASAVGKSYSSVAIALGGMGYKNQPPSWQAEAMSMLRDGATLADAARKFGVTRERVRQVASRMRVESRLCHATIRRRDAEIIAMIDRGIPGGDIAAHFGISERQIYIRERRVRPGEYAKRNRAKRISELEPALARARAGESYLKAADGDKSLAHRVMRAMRAEGVGRETGRWFSEEKRQARLAYIRAGRRDGDTWGEIAARVSALEGKPVSAKNLRLIANKWCPEVFLLRQSGGRLMAATSTEIPTDAVKLALAVAEKLTGDDDDFHGQFMDAVSRVHLGPIDVIRLVEIILSVWPAEGQPS